MSNNNEPVDLVELLSSHQFSSRPTVYFSPFENLGDKMGVRRFVVQLMKEGVIATVKRTKLGKTVKIYELVVRVLEDCRAEEVNQSSPDKRYRFDAGEDVMTTVQSAMNRGVDVYSTPLEILARKSRKGQRVITTIDGRFIEKRESRVQQNKPVNAQPQREDDTDWDKVLEEE
jgi:hypothetical protein